LKVFGSEPQDDFHDMSDVGILVSFSPESRWSLFHLIDMQEELSALFGRKVDLVEREAIRNPFRRKQIMNTLEVLYEA
jgi:predicted nucleotidyltransferase